MVMKDHSNPLSRPYTERLAEQGLVHRVSLPMSIEPYTLDDVNHWLDERGCERKVDYVMSNWSYYFKDKKIAMWVALRWSA
jgi:hypothetical protein